MTGLGRQKVDLGVAKSAVLMDKYSSCEILAESLGAMSSCYFVPATALQPAEQRQVKTWAG